MTRDDLDAAFSRHVRRRDAGRCRRCGVPGTHCHHLYRRSISATRWWPDNGVLLCAYCHLWAHENQSLSLDWAKGALGAERYAALEARARSGMKRRRAEEEAQWFLVTEVQARQVNQPELRRTNRAIIVPRSTRTRTSGTGARSAGRRRRPGTRRAAARPGKTRPRNDSQGGQPVIFREHEDPFSAG